MDKADLPQFALLAKIKARADADNLPADHGLRFVVAQAEPALDLWFDDNLRGQNGMHYHWGRLMQVWNAYTGEDLSHSGGASLKP